MTKSIPRLVVVLDRKGCLLPWTAVAHAALAAGADQIQLREPGQPADVLSAMACELIELGIDAGRLTINGRPQAAIEYATNLHLPALMAKARPDLAADRLLSRSIHTDVPDDPGTDYVVLGNVLPTESHPGKPGLGVDRVRAIVSASTVPVLVIGGIDPGTLGPFMEAGASGVAVRSYIIGSDDPHRATEAVREVLEQWI